MPLLDGREVLREITEDEILRKLPVIVLSASTAPDDMSEMYALRCNSYVVKPHDFVEFATAIQEVGRYWLSAFRIPTNDQR